MITSNKIVYMLVLLLAPSTAMAALHSTLTVTVSPTPAGCTHYAYKVTNGKSSTKDIIDITLSVDEDAHIQNIQVPAGWIVEYNHGNQGLIAVSPRSAATYVHTGSGLQVISFDSPLAPEKRRYWLTGNYDDAVDHYHMNGIPSNSGYVSSPSRFVPSVPDTTNCRPSQPSVPQ